MNIERVNLSKNFTALFIILFLSLFYLSYQAEPVRAQDTTIRFIPEVVELGPEDVVGHNFTVACVVENVSNLAGFDIQIQWNTTYLEYLSHTATVSAEDYPAPNPPSNYSGILHEPELMLKDDVNPVAGTYWEGFATLGGPGFTGDGTAFVMTFRVIDQPAFTEEDITLSLHFTSTDLSDNSLPPQAIPHEAIDGIVIIYSPGPQDVTKVKILPELIELPAEDMVGSELSFACVVENVADLVAFNVLLDWNSTYLEYVNHTTTTPMENFQNPEPPSPYGGILHEPVVNFIDEVNPSGSYWTASATFGGLNFDGNGTVFVITFRLIHQPSPGEPNATLSLTLSKAELTDSASQSIFHLTLNGTIIIQSFTVWDTLMFLNTYPNPIQGNQTLKAQGVLMDENGAVLAHENVRLYARSLNGSWRLIAEATTDERGIFSWSATIPVSVNPGIFILAAYYQGAKTYEPCFSVDILIIE